MLAAAVSEVVWPVRAQPVPSATGGAPGSHSAEVPSLTSDTVCPRFITKRKVLVWVGALVRLASGGSKPSSQWSYCTTCPSVEAVSETIDTIDVVASSGWPTAEVYSWSKL